MQTEVLSASEILITWVDNSDNEDGFKLEWKPGASEDYSQVIPMGANTTAYQDNGLLCEITYYFRLRAYNGAGDSEYANEVSATTEDCPLVLPSDPSNLQAAAGSSSQVNLAWSDNSDNEDGFKLERKTGAGGNYSQVVTIGADTTVYQDTDLLCATVYFYRLRAYNGLGDSEYANEISATTGSCPLAVPSAPSNLQVVAGSSSQVSLTWDDTSDNEEGLKIERKTGSGGTFSQIGILVAGTESFSDFGLACNTEYFYRVRAYNSDGDSSYSSEINIITLACPTNPPYAPSNLQAASASSSQINLSWADNSDNEDNFKIERKTGTEGTYVQIGTADANSTGYQDIGLSCGMAYFYRLRAYNGAGDSDYSNETSATTSGCPPPPPPPPVPANLAQIANTANSFSATFPTYLDMDPARPFIQAPSASKTYWNPPADYAPEYLSDQAVISWGIPANVNPTKVTGFRLYAKACDSDPWSLVADEVALPKNKTYWPNENDLQKNLNFINQIFINNGTSQLFSQNWGSGMGFYLGVTLFYGTGDESPISSILVKDNISPMIMRNNQFGVDPLNYGQLAGLGGTYFYNESAAKLYETIRLSQLVYPTSGTVPTMWTPSSLTPEFGDVAFQIPLSENVTSASMMDVWFVDTSTSPANGLNYVTFPPGWYIEPNDASDGMLVQKRMLSEIDNKMIIVMREAYKLDVGDRLYITNLKDEAGNASSDWVHIVDDIPPMLKSVVVNAPTDTITVVTTERVIDDAASIPAAPNYSHFMRKGYGANPTIELRGLGGDRGAANQTGLNPAGQPRLVDPDADGNYNEHFVIATGASGDADVSSITICLDDVSYVQNGDYIKFAALEDDAWNNSARMPNKSWDRGRWAYWYGDPNHTGAYNPDIFGLGSTDGIIDNIPPRLSARLSQSGTPGPDDPVMAAGPATGPVKPDRDFIFNNLSFTESIYNKPASTTDPGEIDNPSNYQFIIRDCGPDYVCNGYFGSSADDTMIPVTCLSVTPNGTNTKVALSCHTPTSPSRRIYQVVSTGALITVSGVKDLANNIILMGGGAAHNQITYVDFVIGPPFVPSHWLRN